MFLICLNRGLTQAFKESFHNLAGLFYPLLPMFVVELKVVSAPWRALETACASGRRRGWYNQPTIQGTIQGTTSSSRHGTGPGSAIHGRLLSPLFLLVKIIWLFKRPHKLHSGVWSKNWRLEGLFQDDCWDFVITAIIFINDWLPFFFGGGAWWHL